LSGTAPNLTYAPNLNFNGSDSFTFKVNDGTVDSSVATVSITVNPVNDPPVAVDDAYDVDEDNTLTVSAHGVLDNDSDVESDPLTAVLVGDVSSGTLGLGVDGSFTYDPDGNFNGTDSFTYKANDGTVDSNTATVSITVNPINDPPVMTSTPVTIATEDAPYTYDVKATDADGDPLTFSLTTSPGGMTIDANSGLINWTPTNAQVGYNDVVVQVDDGNGSTDAQSFTIDVENVNDPPVITSTPITTATEDILYAYDVEATDPDVGDVLTYSLTASPTGMTINPTTGLIEWTPTDGQVDDNDVVVQVSDGSGGTDSQSFTITVANVNDPPVADDQSVSTDEDTSVAITLTSSDVDGDPLTYALVSSPSNGSLTGTAPNLTYAPNLNFNGGDSFTFKVNDGTVDSNTATVDITVNPVNDPPVATDLRIEPPYPGPEDDLQALYTFSDEENDTESGSLLEWYRNSEYQPYDNLPVLPSSATSPGEQWYFTVTPGDGVDFGDTRTSPSVAIGELLQEINLYPGWNIVSMCLGVPNTDLLSILSSIQGCYNMAWAYDSGLGWKHYTYGGSSAPDELENILPGKGYLIYMYEAATLTIWGAPIFDTSVQLYSGWNLVGCNSLTPQPIEDVVLSMPDGISIYTYDSEAELWLRYIKGGPNFLNNLEEFKPGRGYYIYVEQDCVLSIPY
jgi:VCBS repeat-containing protein